MNGQLESNSKNNMTDESIGSTEKKRTLMYTVDDVPPWHLSLFLGLQASIKSLNHFIDADLITPSLIIYSNTY